MSAQFLVIAQTELQLGELLPAQFGGRAFRCADAVDGSGKIIFGKGAPLFICWALKKWRDYYLVF